MGGPTLHDFRDSRDPVAENQASGSSVPSPYLTPSPDTEAPLSQGYLAWVGQRKVQQQPTHVGLSKTMPGAAEVKEPG